MILGELYYGIQIEATSQAIVEPLRVVPAAQAPPFEVTSALVNSASNRCLLEGVKRMALW